MMLQSCEKLSWWNILMCWVQSVCLKHTWEMFLSSTNELCTAILTCWEKRREENRRSDLAYQFEKNVFSEWSSLSEAEQQRIDFSHDQVMTQTQCSSCNQAQIILWITYRVIWSDIRQNLIWLSIWLFSWIALKQFSSTQLMLGWILKSSRKSSSDNVNLKLSFKFWIVLSVTI